MYAWLVFKQLYFKFANKKAFKKTERKPKQKHETQKPNPVWMLL